MMGHKTPLKSGDEHDAFTPWRHNVRWEAGEKKAIKRRYSKRIRQLAKKEVNDGRNPRLQE